jgi:hypothetical protein
MKIRRITFQKLPGILFVCLGLLLIGFLLQPPASPTQAAPDAPTYEIAWHSTDNGGGISSGGSYEVAATIGQFDAATPANSASYGVESGFWAGFIDFIYEVFLPTVLK